ncbi:hypothetical protein Pan216_20180 [Planctomycetes bacterium Pan216]|uniref:DUF4352 domain-containing protein n=1 Tax=Kolteria novifilia TaxID=2527975 RepID=A0A518B2J8_9BACT|nr:hypothetical protein Pan216_20180 [Planctomycetes bacterium Pan216]
MRTLAPTMLLFALCGCTHSPYMARYDSMELGLDDEETVVAEKPEEEEELVVEHNGWVEVAVTRIDCGDKEQRSRTMLVSLVVTNLAEETLTHYWPGKVAIRREGAPVVTASPDKDALEPMSVLTGHSTELEIICLVDKTDETVVLDFQNSLGWQPKGTTLVALNPPLKVEVPLPREEMTFVQKAATVARELPISASISINDIR